jgi:hypothetical protein
VHQGLSPSLPTQGFIRVLLFGLLLVVLTQLLNWWSRHEQCGWTQASGAIRHVALMASCSH